MQDILSRHFRQTPVNRECYQGSSHPAWLLKTRQLPWERDVNVPIPRARHAILANWYRRNGLGKVDRGQSHYWSGDWLGDHALGRAIRGTVSWLVVRSVTITDDWLHYRRLRTGRASSGHLLVVLYQRGLVLADFFVQRISLWNRYRRKDSADRPAMELQ